MAENKSLTGLSLEEFQKRYAKDYKTDIQAPDVKDISGSGYKAGTLGYLDQALAMKGYSYNAAETSNAKAREGFALNQSTWDLLGEVIKGGGKQALAGALLNIAGNDPVQMANMLAGKEFDTRNELQKYSMNLLKDAQEKYQIIQNPNAESRIWNKQYLASQTQNLGLTAGIVLEGFGEQLLFNALTGGTGAGFAAARGAKTIANLAKLKNFVFGAYQGIKEADMNANFTADEVRERYKQMGGYSDEEVEAIANKAATRAFRTELAPLVLINGLQWGALGHYNPWSKSMPQFMGASSTIESLGSKILEKAPKLGKFGSFTVEQGIQGLSEGFEESYQQGIAKYSQYVTDVEQGKTDGKTLSDYIWNEEMTDNAIGGVLGGLFFGATGKVFAKIGANQSEKMFDESYDRMMKATADRAGDDFRILKNVLENGSDSQKSTARRTVNLHQTLDALNWDFAKKSSDTAMFNTRLQQMQETLDAVESNDEEYLERFGINNDEDKNYIKESYPIMITEANEVKDMLTQNLATSIDFSSAEKKTQLSFSRKMYQEQLNEVQGLIAQTVSTPEFQLLNPKLQKYAQLNAQIQTTADEQKKKSLISQLNELADEEFNPNKLSQKDEDTLSTINEVQNLKDLYTAYSKIEDNINKNTEELAKYATPQRQYETKKKDLDKRISSISTIDSQRGLDRIEAEAKQFGLLTPELTNLIASRRQAIIARREAEAKKPQKQKVTVQEVQNARTEKATEVASQIQTKVDTTPKEEEETRTLLRHTADGKVESYEVMKEEDFLGEFSDMSFKPRLAENSDIKNRFKEDVERYLSKAKRLGIETSFEDLLAHYIKIDPVGAERSYNYIAQGWKDNGKTVDNPQEVYDKFFSTELSRQLLADVMLLPDTQEEVKQAENNQRVTVDVEQAKESILEAERRRLEEEQPTFDDVNKDEESEVISEASTRLAFLGVPYSVTFDKNNESYIFEDANTDINREGGSNLDILLNHRIFKEGTKFSIELSRDWRTQKVHEWYLSEKDGLTYNDVLMEQWMLHKGFTSEEIEAGPDSFKDDAKKYEMWLNKVPMDMFFNGEKIGSGVHDTDWWNERSTSAMIKKEMSRDSFIVLQQKLIKEGRANTTEIRKGVLAGNNDFVVTSRRQGYASFVKDTAPRLRIGETNPDAMLCFMDDKRDIYARLSTGMTVINQNDILNAKSVHDMKPGFAYMLTEAAITEDGRPQYVMNQIITNDKQFQSLGVNAGEFEKWSKSLIIVEKYSKILIENDKSNPEEYSKAVKLKNDIQSLTKMNIADPKGMRNLRGLFPGTRLKDRDTKQIYTLTTPEGKEVPSYNISIQKEGMANNAIPVISQDANGNITVSNYKSQYSGREGYDAFLKDLMTTQRRFFKIKDENGNPMYVAYAQPIIEYGFANKVAKENIKPSTEEEKKVVTEAKEEPKIVVPEEKIEEKPAIESITLGQKQRVVKYLLNNILHSLGEKEATYGEVVKELSGSFNKYLETIKESYPSEYNYLVEHKDEILGLGAYSKEFNTVREQLELWVGEKVRDSDMIGDSDMEEENLGTIDQEGQIMKNLDAAAYEYNVKNSISSRLKRLFSGIPRVQKKTSLQEFAGLPEYYEPDMVFDTVQKLLCDIPNSMDDLEKRIIAKFKSNPKEFEFLIEVLDRLKGVDSQLQKEILFKLNQTQNKMFMVLGNITKRIFKSQVLNADSKEPVLRIQRNFNNNFRISYLIDRVEDGYKVNWSNAKPIVDQFKEWVSKHDATNYVNIDLIEVRDWLGSFGINVSEKSLEDLKNVVKGSDVNSGRTWDTLFRKKGFFHNLVDNLEKLNSSKGILSFDRSNDNVIQLGNGGFLKDLATVEANNTVSSGSVMRIAGKNIMPYAQPNFVSEQLRKLKETDSPLLNNLLKASFSKNSMLVKMLSEKDDLGNYTERSKRLRKIFDIGYVSLQAFKTKKSDSADNSGITELPSTDYNVTLLGFFGNKSNVICQEPTTGIDMMMAKMTFPPLSDSSQMFIVNTLKLNLTNANFTFNEDGTVGIDDNILNLLYEQLVLPDVQRITDYLKAVKSGNSINIENQEVGSQIFTILPELNTLDIKGSELLRRIHSEYDSSIDSIITEDIKTIIKNKIHEVILENVNSKFSEFGDGYTGSWIKENIVNFDNKYKTLRANIDQDYLVSRAEGKITDAQRIKIAALDYTINNYIHQAQIQTIFAGDFSNYTEKPGKMFKDIKKFGKTDTERFFGKMDSLSVEERAKAYIDYMKLSSVNFFKRMKEQLSPGNRIADSKNKTYHQIFVEDRESISSVLESLVKLWYPSEYTKSVDKIQRAYELYDNIEQSYALPNAQIDNYRRELQQEYDEIISDLKKSYPKIADYLKIKFTDGQEFTTWKEHLDILEGQGKISKEVYDRTYEKLSDQSKNGVTKENMLSEEEKSVIFQPIKPLHAGMYFETVGDYTLQRFVYIKTSSFPLLPEATVGMDIDKVRKNIERFEEEKNTRIRVAYKSGVKVGATKNNISMEELYNLDYDSIKDRLNESTIKLERSNFSIQQDKPFKTDKHIAKNEVDENNRGTQIDKILFGNGINKISEDIFPNLFDAELLEQYGIENKEMLSGKDLYNLYNNIAIDEQKAFRRDLFEELGIEENSEWFNSTETLKRIQKILSERMGSYQDQGIIQLKYKTLVDGKYAYYTKQELDERGLEAIGAEFNIPIWISPNSQKFESVLNSLVNNKMIRLKLSGGSSPVASQEGFRMLGDTEETYLDKGIVFTESYDPKKGLQASFYDEEKKYISYAQVLLPCKLTKTIKDASGKDKTVLIDPSEYTKTVDGKTILDFEKIDPEVLRMFSFRIPTSSHQSGAIIEVVGFLPHSMGDTMIVPKDHVTQIGEDFDIDVRYFYRQHTIEDTETGKIRILKASDIPAKSTKEARREMFEKYKNLKDELYNEVNKVKESYWIANRELIYQLAWAKVELSELERYGTNNKSLPEINLEEGIKGLKEEIKYLEDNISSSQAIKNLQSSEKDRFKARFDALEINKSEEKRQIVSQYLSEKYIEELRGKVRENNMIGLYKSIYSSTDTEVQRRINTTLNTDFAKETTDLIQKMLSVGESNHFSILDDRTQREALKLGASGKLGIGVHSNWVVFNSLLEQLPERDRIELINGVYAKTGEPRPFTLRIGDFVSKGLLGTSKTFDGNRSIATVNMENQNCATDNQKLQIMGKRNENSFTINEFALLCNLGFDQGTLKGGKKVHIPSLFISQPIIRRYVELKEIYSSKLAEYTYDTENEITMTLKEEFGEGVEYIPDSLDSTLSTNYMDKDAFDKYSKQMSPDVLVNNLNKPDNNIQWVVFEQFKQLQAASKNLSSVMQLMNIERKGLGISFFNTLDKKDSMLYTMFANNGENLAFNPVLNMMNVDRLFGEKMVVDNISDTEEAELLDEGYVFITRVDNRYYYMKPTNAQNAKLINSVAVGYNLWRNVFPFEDRIVQETIDNVLSFSGIDGSTSKGMDMKYKILSSMKDFLYSYNNTRLFTSGVENERRSLTVDSEDNKSLARKLNELKAKKHPLFEQPFFRDLEFNIFLDGSKPSNIEYNVNANSGINKNEAYTTLESLLDSDKIVDETFGDYTENDLLRDLVKYAMLADQEKGAVGFRNYLPISALDKFGVSFTLRAIASIQNHKFEAVFKGDSFVEQYFQHYPEDAKKVSWTSKKSPIKLKDNTDWSKAATIQLDDETYPYLSVKNPNGNEYALYKSVGEGRYERITTLGGFGMSEYSIGKRVTESLYSSNKIPQSTKQIVIEDTASSNATTDYRLKSGAKAAEEISTIAENGVTEQLKTIAQELKKYALEDTQVVSLEGLANRGFEGIFATRDSGTTFVKGNIYVDSVIANDTTTEKYQTVFLEEYLHSITTLHIREYIKNSGVSLKDGKIVSEIEANNNAPYHIIKLVSLYKQGVQALVDHYTKQGLSVEQIFEKIQITHSVFNNNSKGLEDFSKYSTEDKELLYRTLNVEEFIAGIFVSKEFRDIMSKAKYLDKSILEQFKDVVKRILKALGVEVNGTITDHTVDAVFQMLEEIQKPNKAVNVDQQVLPGFDVIRDVDFFREMSDTIEDDNVEVKQLQVPISIIRKSEKEVLKDIATRNKGKEVFVEYAKYNKPFRAIITGEIEQIISPTQVVHSDGKVDILDDGIYAIQIRTNTGKILTANLNEISGIEEEPLIVEEQSIESLLYSENGGKSPLTLYRGYALTEDREAYNIEETIGKTAVDYDETLKDAIYFTNSQEEASLYAEGRTDKTDEIFIKDGKKITQRNRHYTGDYAKVSKYYISADANVEHYLDINDYRKTGKNSTADVIVLNQGTLFGGNTEYIVRNPSVLVQYNSKDSVREYTPEDITSEKKKIKGINISSSSKGFGAVLTNPTELAKKKGNIEKSYPIRFGNRIYKDVEEGYQDLKSHFTKDDGPGNTYSLMVGLLKAKLEQHPQIKEEITRLGGSEFILASVHQPTSKNTVWETGGKNWFIKALNEAYLNTMNNITFEEEQSTGYRERTIKNASADATLALAVDFETAGEKLTKSSVLNQGKKYMPINANNFEITQERIDKIVDTLNSIGKEDISLNIAGNGIYTIKGKYTQQQVNEFTYQLLKAVIESPKLKVKINSIRTGGQTGFDEAGAKAGIKLGIPTNILAPKGWKFRNINGVDISNEQQFKARFENLKEVSSGKPDFQNLFKDGMIQVQSFYLTLNEFNSMSKEEQNNFIKCL